MFVLFFGITLVNIIFGVHRTKVVNAWIDSTREYTSYVFQCASKVGNLTYDEIVNNANSLLNEEKLNEAISFYESNMNKRLARGISTANSAYYQYIDNFREALKLISTGEPKDVSQGMADISSSLEKINDTTISVNEAVEKINSRQNTSRGMGNNSFEFSIGF
ncbi:MAG: hypothetical protein Q4B63_08205 [Clostridium perfringens]|nr:hypothetical protein [Clostridium perfringens]